MNLRPHTAPAYDRKIGGGYSKQPKKLQFDHHQEPNFESAENFDNSQQDIENEGGIGMGNGWGDQPYNHGFTEGGTNNRQDFMPG